MYKNMMIAAVVIGLLFAVVPAVLKSGSDKRVEEHQAAVAQAEQAIMVALRSFDHARVEEARDVLFELYPRNDAEANQIYEHCLQRFNRERAGR